MKKMFKKHILTTSIITLMSIFTLIFGALPLYAQVRDTDVILNISPQFPKPNESVTATLTSYVTDLSKSYISWSVNNQKINGGVGKSSFTFSMDNSGNQMDINATIGTIDGQNLIKNITVFPTNVDMLWEGIDVYTPPFYRGKTLVPSEGSFKVVAIPNANTVGGSTNPSNFSFAWEKDSVSQPNSSGWGESSFTFKNSYLEKTNEVAVNVSDINGNISTQGRIVLGHVSPRIVFYKKDPNFGIQTEDALGNDFVVDKGGNTIVAIPYFLSPADLNSKDLDFKWYISDSQVSTPNPKNEISIKPDGNSNGTASISLNIENLKSLFVSIGNQITVNF